MKTEKKKTDKQSRPIAFRGSLPCITMPRIDSHDREHH